MLIKKQRWKILSRSRGSGRAQLKVRAEPVVYRLQETHVAALAFAHYRSGGAGATDLLGRAGRARGVLVPGASIRYCVKVLNFRPDFVVGDMAYINLAVHRRLREDFEVAVVTKWRPDMNIPEPFESPTLMSCAQGQRLDWLGLDVREQLHWFGVLDSVCPVLGAKYLSETVRTCATGK